MKHIDFSRARKFRKSFSLCVFACVIIMFLPAGAVEAAATKKVHTECTDCHAEKGSKALKGTLNETCLRCHPASLGGDHPIGVVSAIEPEGLPLEEGKKVACITCHEPHGKNTTGKLLRMDFNRLCIACHKM